jgi:hypothetical protein
VRNDAITQGALDDWYIHNASFWLDLRNKLCRRHCPAPRQPQQQANGEIKKPVARRFETRDKEAARGQPPAKLPVGARARAVQPQRSRWAD